MATCTRCAKEIFGEAVYPIGHDAYCEDCAIDVQQQSGSFSGFGCAGPFIAAKKDGNQP